MSSLKVRRWEWWIFLVPLRPDSAAARNLTYSNADSAPSECTLWWLASWLEDWRLCLPTPFVFDVPLILGVCSLIAASTCSKQKFTLVTPYSPAPEDIKPFIINIWKLLMRKRLYQVEVSKFQFIFCWNKWLETRHTAFGLQKLCLAVCGSLKGIIFVQVWTMASLFELQDVRDYSKISSEMSYKQESTLAVLNRQFFDWIVMIFSQFLQATWTFYYCHRITSRWGLIFS